MNGVSFVLVVVGRWNKEIGRTARKVENRAMKESGSGDFGGNLEKEGRGDNFEFKKALKYKFAYKACNYGVKTRDGCPEGVQEQIVWLCLEVARNLF
jgi:hypothetical protein